ncbi:primosomal protein N' [Caldimonas thermodepolymerans]|jgi:primosomal protein N''|uniref:Replication restart protein PriA n=1 Tax=Caldimonas thermodepolymerans TaxID=215580 RepID=A0AA46HVT4_9BURK|nr:primosomal protein N' [Caldimonas thermodepolymerans]TCP07502.1 replication restart DNA helicase PriA [Caldimonas thermodepolymerans]UZG44008.1 primosomal protein N' [Caldimonas thermodepolymerans]UZG47675.1 primosomal protein N' [Caldimonas thermodepolymerans]
MPTVAVVVDTPQHSTVRGPLSYAADEALPAGALVQVPLGRRTVCGIVWPAGAEEEPGVELKPVAGVLRSLPPLPASWCRLVEFAAGYYQRSVGEVAHAALPAELRKLDDAQLAQRLKKLAKLAPAGGPAPQLPELTEEQVRALEALAQGGAPTALLHGSTGSGKTEVYLRAVAQALQAGRQALVLVPEINLTPQLEARFAERFPDRLIVSLHSGLTPAQRLRHWLAAHLGRADIVLGTRMAVFASLPRLGLVVVDEEHDPSYKSQEGARYSARDLAVYRGKLEGATVLLGSATPSLESWYQAQRGRYLKLSMPTRIGGGTLPRVRLVDMNHVPKEVAFSHALSPPLMEALQQRLARGEQSLVLLNRRGYAPVLQCLECAWKSGCPHCSAWRVFHRSDRTLRCHHCGYTERVPRACPECGNPDIQPLGRGTERLEEQLAVSLPGARVARIDADTTRLKGTLESQLASVHAGEVDVLVGTQMVAKGHDFRRVTLVAAVNPDAALFSSDFRAGERLFALLMQAAGRAGRDAAQAGRSEMLIQTWHPTHPLYAALRAHDYEAFAAETLGEREMAGLPPHAHLALLRAEARTQEAAQAWLQDAARVADELGAAAAGVTLYPPVPMSIARVANVERAQMLLEAASRPALQRLLSAWLPELHGLRGAHKGLLRWAIDVDPLAI